MAEEKLHQQHNWSSPNTPPSRTHLQQQGGLPLRMRDTKFNVITYGISRILSKSSLTHEFPLLITQALSLSGLRHYLPKAAIISLIMAALLQIKSTDPLTTSRLLLTDPG